MQKPSNSYNQDRKKLQKNGNFVYKPSSGTNNLVENKPVLPRTLSGDLPVKSE